MFAGRIFFQGYQTLCWLGLEIHPSTFNIFQSEGTSIWKLWKKALEYNFSFNHLHFQIQAFSKSWLKNPKKSEGCAKCDLQISTHWKLRDSSACQCLSSQGYILQFDYRDFHILQLKYCDALDRHRKSLGSWPTNRHMKAPSQPAVPTQPYFLDLLYCCPEPRFNLWELAVRPPCMWRISALILNLGSLTSSVGLPGHLIYRHCLIL